MALTRWSETAARSLVYMVLRGSPQRGMSRGEISDRLEGRVTYASVSESITRLVGDGYVVGGRALKASGKPLRVYRIDPAAPVPPIVGLEAEIVLNMISDCPAGVSIEMMARQRNVTPEAIRSIGDDLCRRGLARQIVMPARHGGGFGYMPGEPTNNVPVEINCQLDGGVVLNRGDSRISLSFAELATLRSVMDHMRAAAQRSAESRA